MHEGSRSNRLAYGAGYIPRGGLGDKRVTEDARRRFLRAVGQVAPTALDEIASEWVPRIRTLFPKDAVGSGIDALEHAYYETREYPTTEANETRHGEVLPLLDAMIGWANRLNLQTHDRPWAWVVVELIHTSAIWSALEWKLERREFPARGGTSISYAPGHSPGPRTRNFEFRAWINDMPLPDYRRKVEEQFKQYLDEYLNPLQELYGKGKQMRPAPVKLEAEHFEWLARQVVLKQSISQIAREVHRADSSVREALEDVRKLTEIPPARRGRPKGAADKAPGMRRVVGRARPSELHPKKSG